MSESLRELANVEYGASPKEIRAESQTPYKIFGTGGFVGYSVLPLFEEPIVVVARKGTLDKPIFSENPCWVIDTAFAVIPKKDVDAKWLYYQLVNFDLKKLNEATGVPSINREFLYRVNFEKPPLAEQRKISHILSKTDLVIEKTQSAIAKYKAIKQGMLHDLFTRGIDLKTGKLRPVYEDVPELFKESKLGMVPLDWDVDMLGNVCNVTSSKRIYMDDYKDFGIPFYRSLEVILKSKNQEIVTTLYISYEKYETIEKQFGVPKYGDILITSVGTLGISYRVSENDLFYFKDGNLIWFKDFKDKEYSKFLQFTLDELIRKQFDKITIGTSQKAFTIDKLKKLNVYILKEDEYKSICARVEVINNKIHTEQSYLYKLQAIKQGLMSDLLSGKKRVNIDILIKNKKK
jgi:type I restriction enzyme, S subunit